MARSVGTLLDKYKITETEDICDSQLEKISHLCTGEWRLLPQHLQMETLKDINDVPGKENEKRLPFLRLWHQRNGSDATYKTLISALLEIKCVLDAENVCKLLSTVSKSNQEASRIAGDLNELAEFFFVCVCYYPTWLHICPESILYPYVLSLRMHRVKLTVLPIQ